MVLVVVILGVVLIVKAITKDKKEISLDGSTSSVVEKAEMINKLEAEYDGNPYNVPETYTEKDDGFYNQDKKELTDEEITKIKSDIVDRLNSYTADELGLDIDMSKLRTIFNTGTTKIGDSQCFVFNVYEEEDGKLNYITKMAMSIDLKTIYKYDSELFVYRMIGQQ